MTVDSGSQLTLNFEAGLTERFKTALDCVRERAYKQRNPLKTTAADMDLSESELSRKLGHNPNDVRQFTLNDFEAFLKATNDMTPLYYLIDKYLADEDMKRSMAIAQIAKQLPEFLELAKQITGGV